MPISSVMGIVPPRGVVPPGGLPPPGNPPPPPPNRNPPPGPPPPKREPPPPSGPPLGGFAGWWTRYPVTQAFGVNGETGEDIGTPFHTPLSIPFGGHVSRTGCYGYGCEVDVQTMLPGVGGATTEYTIHLDQLSQNVKAGLDIPAGTYIGLSGGENQSQVRQGLFPGAMHPTLDRLSSGPHTEIGFVAGGATPFLAGDRYYNPAPILRNAPPSSGGAPGGLNQSSGGDCNQAYADCIASCNGNVLCESGCGAQYVACLAGGGGFAPPISDVASNVGNSIDFGPLISGASDFGKRAGLFLLAVVGVIAAFYVLVRETNLGSDIQTTVTGSLGKMPLSAHVTTVDRRRSSATGDVGALDALGTGTGTGTGAASRPLGGLLNFPRPAGRGQGQGGGGRARGLGPQGHMATEGAAMHARTFGQGVFALPRAERPAARRATR